MKKKEKRYSWFYEMNDKQFKEMESFYRALGYNEKQTWRLCRECFGAEIRVSKSVPYYPSWTFYHRTERYGTPPEPSGVFGRMFNSMAMHMSVPQFMGGGAQPMMMRSAAPAGALEDYMCMEQECEAMAEPMEGSAPVSEFSTAETNAVPENEAHSPLDSPQMIFSANVNTASWTYLRSRLLCGKPVDKSFVRIEELINSYPFDLPAPEDGALFSLSAETGECPWNKDSELLFIGMKGKKVAEEMRQNLAFLVDVSGSMDDEWVLVQMSMAAIVSKLKKGDVLSVIAYSDNTVTVAENIECGDPDKVIDVILSIEGIGGCTNGSDGLENAYKYLTKNYGEDKNNRVFIFTDGDFNFGVTSEGSLKDLILKKRETGIYLSVVGYGTSNFKDNKMETLARNGNGNYTFVSNPADIVDMLWERLISSLVTVAKDVKISVELNPEFVSSYRLIGYDSRALTQQEFHDTEKAVDGIGSDHVTAALIEFKRGTAKRAFSTRYVTQSSDKNSGEFAFVEVHYKSPEGEDLVCTKAITPQELEASGGKNIPAAALIAAFGLLVKDSEYKGSADKALLKTLLSRALERSAEEAENPFGHFAVIKKYIGNEE